MKDNFHFFMSLFVISLVSFFVLVVSMLPETETSETVRKSSMHPCQKIVMYQYELYERDHRTRYSLSTEDLESWNNFLLDRMKYFSNILEKDCQENLGDWFTDEYDLKMKEVRNAGFDNEN